MLKCRCTVQHKEHLEWQCTLLFIIFLVLSNGNPDKPSSILFGTASNLATIFVNEKNNADS